ncbi:hypothetical protein [Burkholderia gladioli]|uniref:hypothetical protein n=1 Tax=Burkholderia gladioli TaxID=28095 RepID=UPI00163DF3B4|nr:hypothetical protein [Burkholderia gladioli]
MNPNTYVPPDAAVWVNASNGFLPLVEPRNTLVVCAGIFLVALSILLLFAFRWYRFTTFDTRRSAIPPSAPGAILIPLTVLALPIALLFGYLCALASSAWWVSGAFDCSDATPFVNARISVSKPDSNLCFTTAVRSATDGLNTGVQQVTTDAARSVGLPRINGGAR